MKHALLLLSVLALGACTTLYAPVIDGGPVQPGGMARLGQPTQVGRLVATPQAIVEDSRCPINARCVWAGRAIVRTRIDGAGWRETADLTLGQAYPTHGTTIMLTSVEPGKLAGGPVVPPEGYTFGFQGGR